MVRKVNEDSCLERSDLGLWAVALVALAGALLSKESAVAFPALLLGADLARRRWSGDDWSATARLACSACRVLLDQYPTDTPRES